MKTITPLLVLFLAVTAAHPSGEIRNYHHLLSENTWEVDYPIYPILPDDMTAYFSSDGTFQFQGIPLLNRWAVDGEGILYLISNGKVSMKLRFHKETNQFVEFRDKEGSIPLFMKITLKE